MTCAAHFKTDVRRGVRRKFGSEDTRELMSAAGCPQESGVASTTYTRREIMSAEVSASSPVLRTPSQHSRRVRDCPQRLKPQSIPQSWPLQACARRSYPDCRNAVVLPHWVRVTRRPRELGHAALSCVDGKICLGRCDAFGSDIAQRDRVDANYSASPQLTSFPRARQPAATPAGIVSHPSGACRAFNSLPTLARRLTRNAAVFALWRDTVRDIATRERPHVHIFPSFAGVAGRPRLLSARYLPASQGRPQ